mmetsp:Transcript_30511/g.71663  ORF Transcript_30511/g.71663 Transcript_30511/m.71663 type:complete len:352 (-) Transcript_30511:949-2004(-)
MQRPAWLSCSACLGPSSCPKVAGRLSNPLLSKIADSIHSAPTKASMCRQVQLATVQWWGWLCLCVGAKMGSGDAQRKLQALFGLRWSGIEFFVVCCSPLHSYLPQSNCLGLVPFSSSPLDEQDCELLLGYPTVLRFFESFELMLQEDDPLNLTREVERREMHSSLSTTERVLFDGSTRKICADEVALHEWCSRDWCCRGDDFGRCDRCRTSDLGDQDRIDWRNWFCFMHSPEREAEQVHHHPKSTSVLQTLRHCQELASFTLSYINQLLQVLSIWPNVFWQRQTPPIQLCGVDTLTLGRPKQSASECYKHAVGVGGARRHLTTHHSHRSNSYQRKGGLRFLGEDTNGEGPR